MYPSRWMLAVKKEMDKREIVEYSILVSNATMQLISKESGAAAGKGIEKALRPAKDALTDVTLVVAFVEPTLPRNVGSSRGTDGATKAWPVVASAPRADAVSKAAVITKTMARMPGTDGKHCPDGRV